MLKFVGRDNMKFSELREANLSKAQIKKVHDKADDLPKNDFIKRYGKDGDSVRFATATKMVKKELGIEDYEEGFKSDAQRKAAFASGYKEKDKKKEEVELDEVHFSNRNEPPAPKGMHKLRSGRDIPSTPQVDKIHKKVVAMTDRNDHSGARIEIAKACGDKQLVQIFSTLELIHDKYSGAVGNQSIELRGKMMNPLNKAIERKFGKYADVIQDAL